MTSSLFFCQTSTEGLCIYNLFVWSISYTIPSGSPYPLSRVSPYTPSGLVCCQCSFFVHIKNGPEYLSMGTAQVFIPLMRFLPQRLVLINFLVLLRYSFLIFLSSLFDPVFLSTYDFLSRSNAFLIW